MNNNNINNGVINPSFIDHYYQNIPARELVDEIEGAILGSNFTISELLPYIQRKIRRLVGIAAQSHDGKDALLKMLHNQHHATESTEFQKELKTQIQFQALNCFNFDRKLGAAAKEFIQNIGGTGSTTLQMLADMDREPDETLLKNIRLDLDSLSTGTNDLLNEMIYSLVMENRSKDKKYSQFLAKELKTYADQPDQSPYIKKLIKLTSITSIQPNVDFESIEGDEDMLNKAFYGSEFFRPIEECSLEQVNISKQPEMVTAQEFKKLSAAYEELKLQHQVIIKENEQLKETNTLYYMPPKELVQIYEKWRNRLDSAFLVGRIISARGVSETLNLAIQKGQNITKIALMPGNISVMDICLRGGNTACADAFLNFIDFKRVDELEQITLCKSPPLTAEILNKVLLRYEAIFKEIENNTDAPFEEKVKQRALIKNSFMNWTQELYKDFQADFSKGDNSSFIKHLPALLIIGAYTTQSMSWGESFLEEGEERNKGYDRQYNKKIIDSLHNAADAGYIKLDKINQSLDQFDHYLKHYTNGRWRPVIPMNTAGMVAPQILKDALDKLHAEFNPSP